MKNYLMIVMNLNRFYLAGIVLIILVPASAFFYYYPAGNQVYQISTIPALSAGDYNGFVSLGVLKNQGDTGIGTFNGLDGEMIVINRTVYQVKNDGNVYTPADSVLIPFAMVTYFKTSKIITINRSMSYEEFEQTLNAALPSDNIFYCFIVTGTYDNVSARSEPQQTKPYPNLTIALSNQTVFNFTNVNGSMVGFWCPAYASGVNNNDYHFHFLTSDKKHGGHVLNCTVKDVTIQIDYIPSLFVLFNNGESLSMNLKVKGS